MHPRRCICLQGYPGKVAATVTYSLLAASTLSIEFAAESDAATPINLAQHAYFNLEGVDRSRTILDHSVWINRHVLAPEATTFSLCMKPKGPNTYVWTCWVPDGPVCSYSSYVTPVDSTRIPTGEFQAVKDTPLDFSQPRRIGDRVADVPGPLPHGYDVNFALWGRDAAAALEDTHDCIALAQ